MWTRDKSGNDYQHGIKIINLNSGNIIGSLPDQYHPTFTPDGSKLITVSSVNNRFDHISFWSFPSLSPLLTSRAGITDYALAPDGKTLAIFDNQNRIFLLSAIALSIIHQYQTVGLGHVEYMEFSPDGNWLLIQGGGIYVWRVQDVLLWTSTPEADCGIPGRFQFSPDSSLIFGYTEKHIYEGLESNIIPTFYKTNLSVAGTLPTPLVSNQYWFECNFAINTDGSLLALRAFETDKYRGRDVIQLWDVAQKKNYFHSLTSPCTSSEI